MKIKEKNKLPLTFKYIEFSKSKITVKSKSSLTFLLSVKNIKLNISSDLNHTNQLADYCELF